MVFPLKNPANRPLRPPVRRFRPHHHHRQTHMYKYLYLSSPFPSRRHWNKGNSQTDSPHPAHVESFQHHRTKASHFATPTPPTPLSPAISPSSVRTQSPSLLPFPRFLHSVHSQSDRPPVDTQISVSRMVSVLSCFRASYMRRRGGGARSCIASNAIQTGLGAASRRIGGGSLSELVRLKRKGVST